MFLNRDKLIEWFLNWITLFVLLKINLLEKLSSNKGYWNTRFQLNKFK